MSSSFVVTKVLTTTEAREALPGVAKRARAAGLEAEVVFFGPNRRPDVALVPAELLAVLGPYIEDIVIAERVRARRNEFAGQPTKSLVEMGDELGIDPDDVESDTVAARAALGLS